MFNPHIVVLNWKAAQETIECLENLREVNIDAKIVVADNFSCDGSVEEIKRWADRNHQRVFVVAEDSIDSSVLRSDNYDLVIIENFANYGFAGGNNTAIRFAINIGQADVVWLLNNDARVDANTFSELLRRFENDPKVGFVDSVIRYLETPDRMQCYGGVVIHRHLGKRSLYKKNISVAQLSSCDEESVDCLMGASLAFRSEVVKDIGLMETAYFMYGEEVDWQLRARRNGWRIGVARDSHIFHKGAQSTRGRSHMYHYYLNRSSVMFSKRFYGLLSLFTVLPSLFSIVLIQNWKTPKNVIFGWKGILAGTAYRWND